MATDTSMMLTPKVPDAEIERSIERASKALLDCQQPDGHWVFELEVDATIPAEYVLLKHYLGERDELGIESKIAAYLRRTQRAGGGWSLVYNGDFDLSASVKAYFALKMIGDRPDAEHMRRACQAILDHGGAARTNAFTRVLLALYGILGWNNVPVMPVEIMLLPTWFPFHLSKISYWARTTIVPLLVLQALKPKARNPRGVRIDELFLDPPETARRGSKAPHQTWRWFLLFEAIDAVLRAAEPLFPETSRQRAIKKAVAFVCERLNGQHGLGAIFPPMAYSVMMFDALGYPKDHPDVKMARASIDKLLVIKQKEAYCQPCLSPVWDTALACQTLLEVGSERAISEAVRSLRWLEPLQVLDVVGDWGERRPHVRPGGWAFQYVNPYYVDLDDTAVVVMAMDRTAKLAKTGPPQFHDAIARGREWIVGMQCHNGGWAAFDADNTYYYLNNIPFADHGALLDPPTPDLTARCLSMLAQLGERPESSAVMRRAIEFLRRKQRPEGCWFGRWGINYIYGTWSVLCAFAAAGIDPMSSMVRRAVDWLTSIQNPDGGWGEDATSYRLDYRGHEAAPSTASQTAWALLALMAAGEVHCPAAARGISYLRRTQTEDGLWSEECHTATGFPRVLYLRYHGYPKFFPLWALARYRNLKNASESRVFGM
jgi:squalene-hopene/tetraprenyl-beta-curcumene cyclase